MRNLILTGACVLSMCLALAACSNTRDLKHSTRTGKIFDIRVGDQLIPEQMRVRPGDEVRWVNARSEPINIVFVDELKDRLSCQNGFVTGGSIKGMFSENAPIARITTLQPNDHASLCFASAGTYTYNTRMDAVVAGGEKNLRGNIVVE